MFKILTLDWLILKKKFADNILKFRYLDPALESNEGIAGNPPHIFGIRRGVIQKEWGWKILPALCKLVVLLPQKRMPPTRSQGALSEVASGNPDYIGRNWTDALWTTLICKATKHLAADKWPCSEATVEWPAWEEPCSAQNDQVVDPALRDG